MDKRRKTYQRNKVGTMTFRPKGVYMSVSEILNQAVLRRNEPWVCHDLIDEARTLITLDNFVFDEFNKTVQEINNYWKSLSNYRWYDEFEFWASQGTPQNPKYLQPIGESIVL